MTGQDEFTRLFECEDATGRTRFLRLFPNDHGQMVIQAPPPGTATLTLKELMAFYKATIELFPEAQRRGMQ